MIEASLLLGIAIGYILLIFLIGLLAERLAKTRPKIVDNGIVYSLSLGVYCTAWTMFGSIQVAATSGMLFLAVYLGPTIGALFWGIWLKKIIRIKNKYRITSLADFISARYHKSVGLGAMVTGIILVGFIPYIALQIKAIITTSEQLIFSPEKTVDSTSAASLELFMLAGIALVTIIFGLRRLSPTERNPGMVASLAFESIVKISAALIGGGFVVFYLNDGIFPALDRLPALVNENYKLMGATNASDFMTWFSYLFLSMFAVLFLPRQFHVTVIENSDEKHVKTAQWLFPLFLLGINLLVLPVAIYGLQAGLPAKDADGFLITLPLQSKNIWVALIVYIGGLSAGLGMVTTACATISTMLTNQLILPAIEWFPALSFLRRHILKLRWGSAVALILSGYIYQKALGSSAALVSIGMISFVAAFQFAPAIIGGLFWEKASKKGAYLGIGLGFLTWLYTLFIPVFAKSGVLPSNFLVTGPFGLTLLRPEALLGLSGLAPIAHGFLWTGIVNISGFVLGTALFPANDREILHAKEFLDTDDLNNSPGISGKPETENILVTPKLMLIGRLLGQYLVSEDEVAKMVDGILKNTGISGRETISVGELADLGAEAEKTLAGAIGTAAAHQAILHLGLISKAEKKMLADYYAEALSALRISPKELKAKIDYQLTKESLMRQYTKDLESTLSERTAELELSQQKLIQSSKMASLGEMSGGIAHEINTPLATIALCVDSLDHRIEIGKLAPEDVSKKLATIRKTVDRIAQIIRGLRMFSSGGDRIPEEEKEILSLIQDTAILCQDKLNAHDINLSIEGDPDLKISCRAVQISQVVLNLLSNSIDAIASQHDKWIEIKVTDNGSFIQIKVTDSGSGIPEPIAQKIMQPFFTTKDVGKGTGLGLSISSGIIGSHGGKLSLDSTSKNTCFIIELPKGLPVTTVIPSEAQSA